MKQLTITVLMVIAVVLTGISCSREPAEKEDTQAILDELDTANSQIRYLNEKIDSLQTEFNILKADYEQLQQNKDKLQADNNTLQDNYNKLNDNYNTFIEREKQSELYNISWPDLIEVLKRDNTNLLEYKEDVFDCEGFAITLRDRLARYRIRCAYVALGFPEGAGHALNAFQTTDKGLIFVDEVEHDSIAYVEKGKQYGFICLDGVDEDYIDCEGKPDEFWGELVWKKHSNPFSYDYFELNLQRWEFYNQSIDAYNKAVAQYNVSVGKWTGVEMDTWRTNLIALKKDLGTCISPPTKTVETIEIYWN
jgi:cell division protein FtsB